MDISRQLERGGDPTERVPPDGRVRVGQARGGLRVADANGRRIEEPVA